MTKNYKTVFCSTAFAAFAAVSLFSTAGHAESVCAERLAIVKSEMQDPQEGRDQDRPEMIEAKKHLAAAEAALSNSAESNCLRELNEASTQILVESYHHKNKGK